jgi:hypothetical protein
MTTYCNACAEVIHDNDTVTMRDGAYYHYHCRPHTTHGQLMQMHEEAEHHNPSHYRDKSIEPIDAMRSWLGDEAFVAYCRGTIIKYLARLGAKDESVKEARKIEVYARWMRETLEGKGLSK